MLTFFREKFKTIIAYGIIGFVGFVFIFSGVFNPKATRGLHEGAVAGKVNGDAISISEFNRAYQQRLEMFKSMGGGELTEEQIKMFRLKEGVFNELARKRLMAQDAAKQGLLASDEEVRARVAEIPAFQKAGQFDYSAYKAVLSANNYTTASFEKLLRDDLSVERWQQAFRDRVGVSEAEIEREFLMSEEKRNLKYVYLSVEDGKRALKFSDAEVNAFLSDPKNAESLKQQFEREKDTQFKGKVYDQVKAELARERLANDKLADVNRANDALAEKVLAEFSFEPKTDSKKDKAINDLVKGMEGASVKMTGLQSRASLSLPGVGDIREIQSLAFSGGLAKPKKFSVAGGVIIVGVVDSKTADLAQLEKNRVDIIRQLKQKKERELMDAWLKKTTEKAKIDMNPSVVGG